MIQAGLPLQELQFFSAQRMNLYLQFIFFTFAGWVNRHQHAVLEYLQTENQALREQIGKKRIRWPDVQRRRLARARQSPHRICHG